MEHPLRCTDLVDHEVVSKIEEDDEEVEEPVSLCHEQLSVIEPLLENVSFWVEGVILSTVACFGLLGNLLTCLVILSLDRDRSSFNTILMFLIGADTFFLIFMVIDSAYISALKSSEPSWYKVSLIIETNVNSLQLVHR